MAVSRTKNERIDIRLSASNKDDLLRAAAMLGLSLSDFVTMRSLEAAHEILRRRTEIKMSKKDVERFVRALEEDAEPNEALKRAAERYRAEKEKQA